MKMKRIAALLAALTLSCAAAGASARALTKVDAPELTWFQADVPFNPCDILLEADGGVTLAGYLLEKGIPIPPPYDERHESPPERTAAYLTKLDKDGRWQWVKRVADAFAFNNFQQICRLPDGRLLAKWMNYDGTWGSHYYILNDAGEVDEMLPTRTLREAGVETSVRPVSDGYIAGGYTHEGAVSSMTGESVIVRYGADMRELWRLSDDRLAGRMYLEMFETEDGYVFYGEIAAEGMGRGIPSAMKVTGDGQIAWQYNGHKYASAPVNGACGTPDGGVLFTGGNNPAEGAPFGTENAGWLTKLSRDGAVEWSRSYAEHGVIGTYDILPLGEGYLLTVSFETENREVSALYVDADGEPVGYFTLTFPAGETSAFGALREGPDGSAVLFGGFERYERMEDERGVSLTPVQGDAYYVRIDASLFAT